MSGGNHSPEPVLSSPVKNGKGLVSHSPGSLKSRNDTGGQWKKHTRMSLFLVSLCSPDWPRPRNSTSASQVLDLQAFATTPAGKKILSNVKMLKSMFKRMLKSFVVL